MKKKVCENSKGKTILYHDWNGKHSAVSKIDDKTNWAKNYHFCERFTYGGKTCDVNYNVLDYKYIENFLKLFCKVFGC